MLGFCKGFYESLHMTSKNHYFGVCHPKEFFNNYFFIQNYRNNITLTFFTEIIMCRRTIRRLRPSRPTIGRVDKVAQQLSYTCCSRPVVEQLVLSRPTTGRFEIWY